MLGRHRASFLYFCSSVSLSVSVVWKKSVYDRGSGITCAEMRSVPEPSPPWSPTAYLRASKERLRASQLKERSEIVPQPGPFDPSEGALWLYCKENQEKELGQPHISSAVSEGNPGGCLLSGAGEGPWPHSISPRLRSSTNWGLGRGTSQDHWRNTSWGPETFPYTGPRQPFHGAKEALSTWLELLTSGPATTAAVLGRNTGHNMASTSWGS